MKELYIDLETTGLNPKKNGIIQVAGIIVINGKRKESFNYNCAPMENDYVDPKALEVTGHTAEQVKGFQVSKVIYHKLLLLWSKYIDKFDRNDKFHFVAYNGHSFDMPFLREWFKKHNDKFFGSWFYYPSVDVMLTAAHVLREERHRMPNFKLGTVAQYLGINLEHAHDAMADIEATYQIDQYLKERMQSE
jgi:DNA polymerase-3 subunit epsilon